MAMPPCAAPLDMHEMYHLLSELKSKAIMPPIRNAAGKGACRRPGSALQSAVPGREEAYAFTLRD
jgi:hypothetical protein